MYVSPPDGRSVDRGRHPPRCRFICSEHRQSSCTGSVAVSPHRHLHPLWLYRLVRGHPPGGGGLGIRCVCARCSRHPPDQVECGVPQRSPVSARRTNVGSWTDRPRPDRLENASAASLGTKSLALIGHSRDRQLRIVRPELVVGGLRSAVRDWHSRNRIELATASALARTRRRVISIPSSARNNER